MRLTQEQIARGQRTRRKTLFPLTPKEVQRYRAETAFTLRHVDRLPIYAIRQVLQCSPDQARSLVAKGRRLFAPTLKALDLRNCTCPAHHDHTFVGHLPGCPCGGAR